jgi:hypothetical protein
MALDGHDSEVRKNTPDAYIHLYLFAVIIIIGAVILIVVVTFVNIIKVGLVSIEKSFWKPPRA